MKLKFVQSVKMSAKTVRAEDYLKNDDEELDANKPEDDEDSEDVEHVDASDDDGGKKWVGTVSFERVNGSAPVKTIGITVSAGNLIAAAGRAARTAKKHLPFKYRCDMLTLTVRRED